VKKALLLVLVLIATALIALALLSSRTSLELEPLVKMVGSRTPVRVHVSNPHGVRHLSAWLEQDGKTYVVFENHVPASRFGFWRHHVHPRAYAFTAGKENAPALHDGKAKLTIEAKSNDFLGRTDRLTTDVDVATQPPRVQVEDAQHYINQGGSELVTFRPSGYWTEAGVKVNGYTFRSFPLPGRPANERFSLFAYPWDLSADTVPRVYVSNPTGTEVSGRFSYKIFPKSFRSRSLEIDDAFLEKVVNQIDPGVSGDLLSRFLRINGQLRRENNRTLSDLRLKTEQRVLWRGPFLQLSNSQVESQFADIRTYVYKGKKVDQQVHLGFDLAVSRNVPVEAANDGKVLWASDLGIYGNCIVLDHGYGLQSIYGHLSRIDVQVGNMVKKGQKMGLSGSTGLAGGDHLHFSMQVDGVQVNPVEWWDGHWIQDHILGKLPAGDGGSR